MDDKIKKMLVVDDEPAVLQLVNDIFSTCGFQVLNAKDGIEALRIVDAVRETLDILLIDVMMPRMSGTELARVVLTYHPMIEIIFMSGCSDDVIARQGIPGSNMRFINKPFTQFHLVNMVFESLRE